MVPLLVFALLSAQKLDDTYGKTNAQILSMGRPSWEKFYRAKAGDSTASMSSMEGLYGDALAWRNDRSLAKRKDAAKYHALRKGLQAFKNDAVEAGSALSEGGTMWNPIAAGWYADAEETLSGVLGVGKPAPARKVSDVTKEIAALKKAVGVSDLDGEWKRQAPVALKSLDRDWAAVLRIAKTLTRRQSDLVLDFCRATTRGARESAGG